MLKAIKRTWLYEEIVSQIQQLIKEGVLKPGDKLPPERELAERLKVSRASVREGIRTLEQKGLVERKPGAGTFVSADSLDSLIQALAGRLLEEKDTLSDIFEMRWLLEPQVASLAAQRATQEDLRRLREALEEQERQIGRGESGAEADGTFHFSIARATHNSALLTLSSAIASVLGRSREHHLQSPERSRRSLLSHQSILAAIEARDPQGAREAMERHITEVDEDALSLSVLQRAPREEGAPLEQVLARGT